MLDGVRHEIFDKFDGHCHFCGDPLIFDNRGWAELMNGHWEVDHIVQRDKGGAKTAENCLPACTRCNRLRWHRTGNAVRDLLLLGIIAAEEIRKHTNTGDELLRLRTKRLRDNELRRIKRLAQHQSAIASSASL